ncbi:MAG: hypothetical protein ACRERC_14105 [Candidatus Binatia bacterium]
MSGACYRCGRAVPEGERIGRREACLGCGSELHCCRNCRFYDPRYHNQCRETQAERQVDKARANFCDYFALGDAASAAAAAPVSPRAGLDALFGARRKP